MKQLELNQMEILEGGSAGGLLSGLTCGIMIAGAVALIFSTGPLGVAIIAGAGGTVSCAASVAWWSWN